ncbi:MAG: hypothetical protein Q7J15_05530 [Candidatus Desulfaltia sp.]|nr:hypothetical protein [Candidatus Desulfaltia sp.]
MHGYFITKEKAIEFGLLKNPLISAELQKTIIAITENDILEHQKDFHFCESHFSEIANWFYKNYYNNLIQTFNTFQDVG